MEGILKEFSRLSKSKGFERCEEQVDNFLIALEDTKSAILSGTITFLIFFVQLLTLNQILRIHPVI